MGRGGAGATFHIHIKSKFNGFNLSFIRVAGEQQEHKDEQEIMLASDEDQGESGEEEQDVAKEGIFRSWLDASVTLPFVAPEVPHQHQHISSL